MRVLHFSDVHVQVPVAHLGASDWASKRAVGALNLLARRGRYFRNAPTKLAQLARFGVAQQAELVVCTGDYTALGTEEEHRLARQAVQDLSLAPAGYVTVAGNHDVYLADTLASDRFQRHFGAFLRSDWPEVGVDGGWPFVRLFGEHLAVVGVNSARPNPNPVRSSGRVPEVQLDALRGVLADPRLRDRWVLVLSHYGLLRQDGKPDSAHHGLENARALAACVCSHARAVLLHGHVHWRYFHAASASRPPSFCAGSTTHEGREGAWLFDVRAERLTAVPCGYEDGRYVAETAAPIVIPA